MSVYYESAPTNSSCLVTERPLTSPAARTSADKVAVYIISLLHYGSPPIDSKVFDYRGVPDTPNRSSCRLTRVQCNSRLLFLTHYLLFLLLDSMFG